MKLLLSLIALFLAMLFMVACSEVVVFGSCRAPVTDMFQNDYGHECLVGFKKEW